MSKNELIAKMTGVVAKTTFQLKKHSPEILLVGGIVGLVASGVMACFATTKVGEVVEQSKECLDIIHENKEIAPIEETRKNTAKVYVRTGVEFAKLYGPSLALGTASIACILASNNVLRKRNAAIAAAYATLDRSFKDYKNRVIERFGETVDKELTYGLKPQKVEEIVVDEETGKEKKVKKTIEISDGQLCSPFARFFDDGCKGWEKDAEMNLFFLRAEQNFANDRLRTRGYVYINEIYERLGIKPTAQGHDVGWIYDPDNPNHKGDNYIDFGIYDTHRQNGKCRDFVNGIERVILLDFNVDGIITPELDRIVAKMEG